MSRPGVLLDLTPRVRTGERHLASKPGPGPKVVGMSSRIARMWMLKKAMPPPRAGGMPLWSTPPTVCQS
jgi:hypothetical protein